MTTQPLTDNAGVLAPAPIIYGSAILIGLAAEFALPIAHLPRPGSLWFGAGIIVTAIAIVLSAVKALARAKTAFDARKSTSAVVTDGAFRHTRNPTYLSLTLLQIGVASLLQSSWILLMVIPAVLATHWGVVLREERYHEAKFGDDYRRYKSSVRRWV